MSRFIGRKPQAEVIEEFATYVSSGRVAVYKALDAAIVPGRREGIYLYDLEGNRYINCRTSGGVFNLGHRPPRVVAAVKAALDELDVGDHLLMSEQRAALAHRLADLTPGDIQYTTFASGGAEAIDIAIKLARAYTGRPKIISARRGYHGHTGFALAAGSDFFKNKFGPIPPGFYNVPFGDIAAMEEMVDDQTAAVILETIPAVGGVLIPPDDYYPRLRQLCDERGAQLILDEVQTGLGRTGRMWAIEEWEVVPDILVMGKGLSGGVYPMAATCYRPHLNDFFEREPFSHLSTFGGADLGCVAAMAMLDQITEPGFLEHVQAMAAQFADGLTRLQRRYPDLVRDIRQRGLFIGLELPDDSYGMRFTAALARQGVIANFANNFPATMLILPPLIIQPEGVEMVLAALDRACATLA